MAQCPPALYVQFETSPQALVAGCWRALACCSFLFMSHTLCTPWCAMDAAAFSVRSHCSTIHDVHAVVQAPYACGHQGQGQ